jgi:hypothetical protein
MTVHIRASGRVLCGGQLWSVNAWVFTLAPACRFRDVTCAACLRMQIDECQARALRETTPSTVACELEAERVCRETLAGLSLKEAS